MNYFLFEVGVEISDHPLTTDLSSYPISVALQVGNMLLQGMRQISMLFFKLEAHLCKMGYHLTLYRMNIKGQN
jgi:hypothetical protein